MSELSHQTLPEPELPPRTYQGSDHDVLGGDVAGLAEDVLRLAIHGDALKQALAIQDELKRGSIDPFNDDRLLLTIGKLLGRDLLDIEESTFIEQPFAELMTEAEQLQAELAQEKDAAVDTLRDRFDEFAELLSEDPALWTRKERILAASERYLFEQMPAFLKEQFEHSRPWHAAGQDDKVTPGLFKWLANDDARAGASKEQLTNFAQWQLDHYQKINQDPEVRRLLEAEREHFIQKLEHLVDQGKAPADVLERARSFKPDHIRIFDELYYFDTKGGVRPLGQYERWNDPRPNLVTLAAIHSQHIVDHEMTHHAIEGERSDGVQWPRWFSEAGTENFARLMEPVPQGADTIYMAERTVLHMMLIEGLVEIEPEIARQAFMERGAQREARDEFERQLQLAWPADKGNIIDYIEILFNNRAAEGIRGMQVAKEIHQKLIDLEQEIIDSDRRATVSG